MPEKTRPCEICGAMIDPERIEHLPETRLCGEHARAIEKHGGELKVKLEQTSLAKPDSMKRNPGDVAVVGKERNEKAMEKLRREIEGT
jgi:hypothetical protein